MALIFMGMKKLNEKMKEKKAEKKHKQQDAAVANGQYRQDSATGPAQQTPLYQSHDQQSTYQPQATQNGGYGDGSAGGMK